MVPETPPSEIVLDAVISALHRIDSFLCCPGRAERSVKMCGFWDGAE